MPKFERTAEDIKQIVKDENVRFLRLMFTDILGTNKNVEVPVSQLDKVLENKMMFDGSSIEGFVRIEESDMYLYPDLSTFEIFPWRPQQGKVARLICDVYRSDGTPFQGDPRQVLKKAVAHAAELGYEFEVGPECEFFLFNVDENGRPSTESYEQAGYFDLDPQEIGENARRDMVLTLEDMGLGVEASHHEAAPAQHEIDLKYDEAISTADNLMTFKMAVKTIAKRHGLHATFMPKPKFGINGSGMHINMSLNRDGQNIFNDPSGELGLSKEAYYFMGGIIRHMKGMTLITNPLVNSYKRLVPGYEAPVYIAWSASNRSLAVRVPFAQGAGSRIELRCPDPAANPYLALAVCLEAGLQGIIEKIEPPKSVDCNIFAMSEEEKEAKNIEAVPDSLDEAMEEFEKDAFIQQILGEHIAKKYLAVKKQEWAEYREQITDWETKKYLNQF